MNVSRRMYTCKLCTCTLCMPCHSVCYAACTPCTHTHSVGCICRHDMLCTCILYHSVCYAACTHTCIPHTLYHSCITCHVSHVMSWHTRWILSHVSQHVHNHLVYMHSVGTSRDIQMSCRMVVHMYEHSVLTWHPNHTSCMSCCASNGKPLQMVQASCACHVCTLA